MPFTVILLPADPEAAAPAYEASIEASAMAGGGRLGPGGAVRLPDGGEFFFQHNELSLGALSGDVCKVIFEAALRTNTYITNAGGGSDLTPLKPADSTVQVPRGMGRPLTVPNPRVLCDRLKIRLAHWRRFVRDEQARGMMGAKEEVLQPPRGPGAEPRLAVDPTGVAEDCRASQRSLSRFGWKVLRSVVSRNAQYGVVWRADVQAADSPDYLMRVVCWKTPGRHGGFVVSNGPLEMFDPAESVNPLDAEDAPSPH